MATIQRSLALSAAQSYISVALQLVSTVVLSRVLTPTEVGVFAVAAVFAALAANFRDFGIAEYLIQAKELNHTQIRAAFTINLAMSWAMGIAMAAGADWVGAFYRSETIADVMRVQALNFLLIPFSAINMAWFRREMNFVPMVVSTMWSEVAALAVAIGLALQGHGAMSLAWASLVNVVVALVVSEVYRPRHLPRRPGLTGLREVLRFGGFASTIYVLGQVGKGAPEMVIGRAQGVTEVALFSRAGGLVQLFRQLVVRAIMPVCLPYFAQAQRQQGQVRTAYGRGMAVLTVVGWPCLGFLGIAAYPSIRLVYGDQWLSVVPLAQLLCLAAALELVHWLAKDALMSQGRIERATQLQLCIQLLQLAGLTAVLPFGLPGACWGLLAAAAVGLAVSQWLVADSTGFGMRDLFSACARSLAVTLASLAPMAGLVLAMPPGEHNYLSLLLIGAPATALAWLVALRFSGHALWDDVLRARSAVLAKLERRRSSNG